MTGLRAIGLAAVAAAALAAGEGCAAERRLLGPEESTAWAAVGRLNVAGRRFCTATLIAPDTALTAAHCLFHPHTGRAVPPSELRFVMGYRLGGYAAVRGIARVALPDGHRHDGEASYEVMRRDLALIALDHPVTEAAPLQVAGDWPPLATVISYGRDRAHAPSIQQGCALAEDFGEVAALACTVTPGASGSPVFAVGEAGPRIVGVVSAVGEGRVYAVRTAGQIEGLLAALAEGR